MEKLLKSLMKKKHHFILTLLLIIFILFDIKIPLVFAELIDNPVGKISVAISTLYLLSKNKLAGVIGIVAAFILLQRASDATGTEGKKLYLPSEHKSLNIYHP